MALPPGLAVSVLKAIFQEVHVQVSGNSHYGILLCLLALDRTRIRWQSNITCKVLNSFRSLTMLTC